MAIELGGFAEIPSDIDGTEEDLNAFNFCLASDYITALGDENFEEVGDIDFYLFDEILYWYNYTEGLNNDKEVEELYAGTFLTYNERTIIDAILDKRYASLADVYLMRKDARRLYSPKLVLATLLVDSKYPVEIPYEDQEDLDKKLEELYILIESEYNKATDKKEFLIRLHNNLSRIRMAKGVIVKPLTDKYSWSKARINKEYE